MLIRRNNIRINKSEIAGFTLIEVMVAAVILFSVIATVSMVYRGAFLSSEKANNHINLTSVLPSVLENIKKDIQDVSLTNVTEVVQNSSAWLVKYQWKAKVIQFKSAPEKLDVDSGNFIIPPKKYKLWEIDLTLEFNGLVKQYRYNELGWTND